MKKKSAGSVAIMLLVMIYLLIPLVISIIYSVFHKWTGVIPEGFTLHNYVDLFTDSNFLASVGRSIAMSIIPIIGDDRDRPSGIICNGDLFSET